MSDKNNVMESISAFLKENSRDAKQAIHRLQNLNHSLIKSYADKSLKLQEEFNRSKKSAEDILKAAQTKINSDKNLKEIEKQRLNDKAAERCRLQIAAAQKIYDKQLQEYLSVKVKEILKTVKEEYASIQINEADLQGFASILETQIQAATSASMVRSLSEVLKRAESNIGGPANVSGILKEMQTKMASSVGKFSSYTLELEKLAKTNHDNAGVRQALENISDSQDKMQKEMNNVNIEIEQHLEATRKAEENIQNFFMRHKGDWDRLSKEDIAEQQRLLGVIDDLKDKQEALHAKQKETYIKISKLAKDALKNKGNVVSSLAEKVKEIDADIKSVEAEFNAGKKQYTAQKEDLHRLEKSLIGKRLSTGMDTSDDKAWDAANKSIKFVSGGDQARKASSEKWLKARVDEDKAMGRLIKGFYSAKIGWQRKKGIAKIGGLVTGIGGSIASDIHGSVRKWKTSGGLGKFLVGSALDWGMTKIKKGIDYRSMSKLSHEASKLKENYLTLLQKNATADAVNKAKYEYNKKIVQLYDLNMNAATLGRHFLGQKHSGIFDEGKEAKEADAIRKEIAEYEKEFKGKTASVSGGNLLGRFAKTGKNWIGRAKSLAANGRSYGRRLASIGIPMRPQMAPEPIPMAEGGVVARIGEGKHSEAVIPLAGRGAKMVGEAIGQKVGQAAGKKGMQYKSSQQMEEEQKAAENQANIASNVATIVRLLEEQNKLAKQKKPESLLSKILGFLGMMATALLPKILKFIKFAWKGIRLVGKILKPVIRLLSKLGGPLLKLLGMLGKGLFGLLGKLGKGAGALLSGAKEGAAKLGEKVKDFTGKGKGGKAQGKAPKTRRLGLGRDVGNAGKAAGKGGLKSAGKMLGRLAGPLTAALAAYDAYEAWNDEDLHKRAFGLKDGEKASTGQKIQAGMAGAGAGILNIGSGAVGLLGSGARAIGMDGLADSLDKVADFIEFDPATLIKAYNAPLKTIGGKLLELTDGIPVLGDAVKGIGDFIESSPMLKGAVNWLDEHNPLKAITEGVGKTIDWFNSDTKWEDLKSGFKAVGSAITDTCCNVGAWFSEKAQNIGSWIGEKASGAWEGVKSGFSAADEWVGEKAESAWNFIKENNPIAVTQQGFEKAKDFFDKNAPAAWNFIKENNPIALAKKGFEGVKGFFAEKFGNISNWLSGDNNPFQPIFNFLNSIGEFFKGLTLSGLAQKTGLVPDFLVSWLQEKGLAQGGLVKASRGGTLAVIGEGGEDEAVLPLSKLAQIIYESFKIHDALLGKRSSALGEESKSIADIGALAGIIGNGTGIEEPRAGWAVDLLEEIKQIGKNIELMTKMMKLIKVDGITLGELVENKMLAMGGGVSGAAAQAAQAAQQAAGMANPASPSYGGGGGQTPMYPAQSGGQGGGVYGAAPFIGGQKAGGVSGKYGAITGMRDELVLPLSQRAKGANGKPMEWSQATNNPGNVGNTDQGRTNIFPDLQSGLRAQAELLQKRYSGMTLLQMCQKYTPTKWQTAIKTWTTSGIKENEVPNLSDPGTMARLLKAIHKAEGSSKWVPEEEVDYALGLRQMPEGYQKKDYRQLTEKGRALVGKPDQSTPPPQTPGAAGTQAPNPAAGAAAGAAPSIVPQAKFMPAANGDPYKQTLVPQMPAQQPAAQQSPEASFKGSVNNILQIAQKNASISGKHGYSKENRLGSNQFDCSSFVGRSLQEAGYNVGPISDFTTPKMPAKLGPKGLKFPWTSGLQGIQPGDIAWRNGHTEISIGGGKTIGALNSDAGVGVHPLSWGKYTGYWRPTGAVSGGDQQGQEQQGQSASPQGANPSPQMQPVQPAVGQAPSFVPRPSAPPAGMQPMANPSPAIGGLQKPLPVDNYQPPAQAQSPSGGAAAPMLNLPKSNLPLERRETLSAKKQQIANLVIAEAKRQGVDPRLALALANQESRFNQNDVSDAGAVGVMQLMKCDVAAYGGGDRYNINDNIRMGVTQLRKKLDLAHGDVREALLRYNWGDGNFNKWKKGLRTDMPKEARQYADRVLGHIDNGTVEGIMKAAGEPAASGGINPYTPQQQGNPTIPGLTQGPPVQGMPPQQGPAIPGLSGIYAAMTANAMQRGVKYKMGARNSRTGRIDCSGWTIEMGRQIMQGVQDPAARARLGQVLAGGTAEGIISKGLQMQGGQSASLDPSQIKEGTMIGIKARPGKHGSDRPMGIGHIVTTFRDPNTGRMMVSESTSNDGHGRSGVITTDYEQWYKEHSNRTMWGVDTGALIGGQFDAGNVKAQMEAGGAQQTQYGMGATPQSGPQIQASQQGMVNEQAAAYYAQGGGGGNIDASTNINGMPGGGGKKPSVEMVLNKDPMGWIVLQGNAVH